MRSRAPCESKPLASVRSAARKVVSAQVIGLTIVCRSELDLPSLQTASMLSGDDQFLQWWQDWPTGHVCPCAIRATAIPPVPPDGHPAKQNQLPMAAVALMVSQHVVQAAL